MTWSKAQQGSDGLLPGGYITYTVMTKMPGADVMGLKFWSMSDEGREAIRDSFIKALK